jgi:hypothetical protein
MNNKKPFQMRPLLAAVIVSTGFTLTLPVTTKPAHALLPVTDYANFIQATYSDMMRAIESSKELAVLKNTLSAIGTFAEMQIDTVNNGFANVIARLDGGEEERQQLEQMERSQPAQDACATVVVSKGINEASCAAEDSMAQAVTSRAQNNSMSTGGGSFTCNNGECTYKPGVPPSAADVNDKNTEDAKAVIDECETLLDDQGKSYCEQPHLLLFGHALDKKQYRAVEIQNQIAANINKPVPHADDRLEKDSPEFKRARAEDLRRENIRESASAALHNLHVLQNGTSEIVNGERQRGEIELLEQYMGERLGSENWVCEVTQSCADSNSYVPPAEIEKRKIELDAVMLHIALQSYKSSLRTEKYLVDLNLMEIESVKK